MGIVFARKYRVDPFFRTEANIIALQVFFSLAVVAFISAALSLFYHSTLSAIVSRLQETIANTSTKGAESHLITVPGFTEVQTGPLFLIIAAGVLIALAFGYFIVRVALLPTKNALASQKQFIGNIAHELRTPLSVIKINTEVRLLDSDVSESARELHRSTLEELDRISEIINNLLSLDTLVRPGALEFSDVDLGAVVNSATKSLSDLAYRRHVTVSAKLSEFRTVFGNETALMQIVVNILKNAIFYTKAGGNVSVTVQPDYRGAVTLSVKDTGVGIAEKDLFKIFEPFYRGSASRTRNDGGSGLGLAIVSELVHLHHGKITIRSGIDRGTAVTVSFPAGNIPSGDEIKREKGGTEGGEIAIDFSRKNS